jgi:hypothetical protein
MAQRVKLYKGDQVKEVWAENAEKFLSDGWSAEQPKVQSKTKSAVRKTETKEA